MTHWLSHCTGVFLISPSIDVTNVTMNGSLCLAAPGGWKPLSSPSAPGQDYALHVSMSGISLLCSPCGLHCSLLHLTMLHCLTLHGTRTGAHINT